VALFASLLHGVQLGASPYTAVQSADMSPLGHEHSPIDFGMTRPLADLNEPYIELRLLCGFRFRESPPIDSKELRSV
jgi:hypothetical protein